MLPGSVPPIEAESLSLTPGDYYRVDVCRLTYSEGWRLTRSWKVIVLWWNKLLGNALNLVPGLPAPRPLRENLVSRDDIPLAVTRALDEIQQQCEEQGFEDPRYYTQKESLLPTELAACVLRQSSGETVAILLCIRSLLTDKARQVVVSYFTGLRDGRLLMTSNESLYFNRPGGDDLAYLPEADPGTLYQEHLRRLEAHRATGNPAVPAASFDEIADLLWRDEQRVFQYNIKRGVFVRMTPVEVASALASRSAGERAAAVASPVVGEEAVAVLAALARRERPAGSSTASFLVFLISLAAFVAVSRLRWTWDFIALLVGAVFIHEMGHYLAMRAFGYRNLRMFFIPFLGAAVSGLNPRAAGWQKALVSLAGPLPGIALGAGLYLANAHHGGDPLMLRAALVFLLLNTFNLLPLLPLDGGRFVYDVVFCRHPLLRAVFSGLAGLGMLAAAYYFHAVFLGIIGVFVLLGVRQVLHVNHAIRRLRREGVGLTEPASAPGQEEPVRAEALPPLIDALKDARQQAPTRSMLVVEALAVIDQARARPPRLMATLGLLALYAAAWTLAVYPLLPVLARRPWLRVHHRGEMRRETDPAREQPEREGEQPGDTSPTSSAR